MSKIDIFGDGRKTPKISINVKVKVNTVTPEESHKWNKVFGYIMKKPRTKLEFLAVDAIRCLSLDKIQLEDIKSYISEEDYKELKLVEKIFNKRLTSDIKAFILSILKMKINVLQQIIDSKQNTTLVTE